MKQIALIAAGSQPWNSDVCAALSDCFAYCSSMAIYIYKRDERLKDYRLDSILAHHKCRIVCIAWNHVNRELLASADAKEIVVWSVRSKSKLYELNHLERFYPICSIFWNVWEEDCVAFLCARADKAHKNILAPEPANENEICSVKELCWDPLSSDYLLVLNKNSLIRLVDVNNVPTVLMTFNFTSTNQLACMTWISNAPGMFITTETQSSKLTLWNVSHASPVLVVPTKVKGITEYHSILFIPESSEPGTPGHLEDSRSRQNKVKDPGQWVELPPGKILCTFANGGVGLYNLRRRKWDFYREMGHMETVFMVEFHPENCNILASGGFDRILKIWNISNMSLMNSMKFNSIIYSSSWSPDGERLAVATQNNGVKMWDLIRNDVRDVLDELNHKIYCVSWNHKTPCLLASCSESGNLYIHDLNSMKAFYHKHPGSVYGCHWNPLESNLIATACGDGKVRLIRLSNTLECIKVLSGHEVRAFQVKWSPTYNWILISGSDDCCIKMWDTGREVCLHTFVAHSRPVRGLLWSPEIPFLFFSGSWDSSIQVWDTRLGHAVNSIGCHGADVYGLSCHQKRPFLIASSSRDSTVRLTDVSKLVLSLHVKLLLGHPLKDICLHSSIPEPQKNSRLGFCGIHSGVLSKLLLDGTMERAPREISNFFGGSLGLENLWDLVEIHKGKDVSLLPAAYRNGILHRKHLFHFKMFEAVELEGGGSELMGAKGAPTRSRVDKLLQSAQMEMNLGNLDKYCEILIQLKEWDKALAIAPSVSLEFWRSLMKRRCTEFKKDDSLDEESLPYFAALGKADDLVEYYMSIGSHADAMLVAEGFQSPSNVQRLDEEVKGKPKNQGDCTPLQEGDINLNIRKIMAERADKYFYSGYPVLAACCHMAMDDVNSMMSKLIRGGEWELAICIGNHLGNVKDYVSEAARYLARKCEKRNLRHLAMDVIQKFVVRDKEHPLGQICCRVPQADALRNDLLSKAGLPSPIECREIAERLEKAPVHVRDDFEVVKHYLLSDEWLKGLEYGIQKFKEAMLSQPDKPSKVQGIIQMMSSLNTNHLSEHQHSIISKHDLDIGINNHVLSGELETWLQKKGEDYKQLLAKADDLSDPYEVVEKGCDILTGSLLPSHNTVSSVSLFAKNSIQGQSYGLEGGCWSITMNEAVMWAKVNNLSPFCSGEQINPF